MIDDVYNWLAVMITAGKRRYSVVFSLPRLP
jgi:hypothetical protein